MSTVTAGGVEMTALVDEGLGNSAYLVDLGDGSALVVDASRDPRALRVAIRRAGGHRPRVRFVAETHLHADFVSAATQLAHDEGATIVASLAGRRAFAHRGLVDGDEVDLGGLRLTALATPGHTDEHLAFLLSDGARPVGVFSGGSLIVGSAARTDLLGAERAEALARAQFGSLRRLAGLPADTALWPTHGTGSFCSAPPGTERTSTIGRELAINPLLRARDEQEFVTQLLGSLGSYPAYFSRLGEVNRRGPAVLDAGAGQLAGLSVPAVRELLAQGAVVVDARPVPSYAAGHVPGALSIPLRAQFATWLGWLVPPDTPIVVVREPDQDAEEIAWQALKIGYETLAGELAGGMTAWRAADQPVVRTELVRPDQQPPGRVLDVRQRAEFLGGHLPGAHHLELGALRDAATPLPDDEPVVVMCGHGERAAGAASLLERAGHQRLAIMVGGPDDWARATGQSLPTGP